VIGCGAGYEGTSTYLYLGSNPRPGQLPSLAWSRVVWHQRASSGISSADLDLDGFLEFAAAAEGWAQSVFPPYRTGTDLQLLANRFASGGTLAFDAGLSDLYDFEPDLVPEPRLALGEFLGDSRIDALAGPLADEEVEISKLHRQLPRGFYYRFERSYQVVSPGHLVDLDGDGELDVLGETITFHRPRP
jgi:hypothetical protein